MMRTADLVRILLVLYSAILTGTCPHCPEHNNIYKKIVSNKRGRRSLFIGIAKQLLRDTLLICMLYLMMRHLLMGFLFKPDLCMFGIEPNPGPVTSLVPGREFLMSTPEINELSIGVDGSQIVITFPEESDFSGSFKSSDRDHLIRIDGLTVCVPIASFEKIPHNVCLAMLNTDYTEGDLQVSTGQTPDFCRITERGLVILDMKTQKTLNFSNLESASMDVVRKYSSIAGTSPDLISGICVGMEEVATHNIDLSDDFKEVLIRAFRLGRRIQDQVRSSLPDEIPDLERGIADESLKQVDFEPELLRGIDERLQITEEILLSIGDLEPRDPYELLRQAPDLPSFKTIDQYLDNLPGEKMYVESFIHVPMIIPHTSASHEISKEAPFYRDEKVDIVSSMKELWETISPFTLEDPSNFLSLLMFRQEKLTVKEREMRSPPPEEILVTDAFSIELAKRGIDGGKMKRSQPESFPKNDKAGLNGRINTSRMDKFCSTPIKFHNKGFPLDDKDFLPSGDESMKKVYELMYNTDLIEACETLDLICRELLYNQPKHLKQSTKDSLNRKKFIFRKIPNKEVYLLIKPTSLKGNKPIFFSVLFRGKPLENCGVFQKCREMEGGWMYTDFISMDSDRLSNLINVHVQVINLWSLCVEKFKGGLRFNSTTSSIMSADVTIALKNLTALLIEDKEDVSTTHQLLRYYYMKVCAGKEMYGMEPERITGKFPEVIRSPVLLRTIQKMGDTSTSLVTKEDTEEEVFTFLSSNTPFGIIIKHPDEMVLISYICMLHNKDEGDDNYGQIQCIKKLVKMEVKLRRKLLDQNYSPFCSSPQDFYEFCPKTVKFAAGLLMETLASGGHTIQNKEGKNEISLDMMVELSQLSLKDVSTTKASTRSIYEGDMSEIDLKKINKVIPKRTKCFVAVWDMLGNILTDIMVVRNILNIFSAIKKSPYVLVSLFKKNQIGGVREISILDFLSRTFVAQLEFLARGICGMIKEEALTKPKDKLKFLNDHKIKVNRERPADSLAYTFRISSDMTTWCQSFMMIMFAIMYSVLLPKRLWGFMMNVLNLMQRKRVELPSSVIKNLVKKNMLDDEVFQALDDEEEGRSNLGLKQKGKCYINLMGNMLQGILHYTSSLYHVCHLLYYCHEVERYFKNCGYHCVTSFQTSSDDEGILVTVFMPNRSRVNRTHFHTISRVLMRMKASVDALFGLKMSLEKTVITILPIYEFNSIFQFGNMIINPLIKQIARTCDDNVEESIHKRINNYLSQIRAVRECGGSGAICQMINMSQTISLHRNLGKGTMLWWDADCEEFFREIPLTINGFYPVMPMITAGFADSALINYYSLPKDSDSKISTLIRSFGLTCDNELEIIDGYASSFSAWNRKKHLEQLERMGIQNEEMSEGEFKALLKTPTDIETFRVHLKVMARSKSVSRAFARLKRSDMARVAVFYFWKNNIEQRGVSGRTHLSTLLLSLRSSPPCTSLFVNSEYYDRLLAEHLSQPVYSSTTMKPMHPCTVHSYKPSSDDYVKLKIILNNYWYNDNYRMGREETRHRSSKLIKLLPWIKPTIEETLSNDYFDGSYNKLLSTMESLKDFKTSISVFSRKTESKTRFYDSLPEYNTITGYVRHRVLAQDDPVQKSDSAIGIELGLMVGRFCQLIKDSGSEVDDSIKRDFKELLNQKLSQVSPSPQDWNSRFPKANSARLLKSMVLNASYDDGIFSYIKETKSLLWLKTSLKKGKSFMGESVCFYYSDLLGWVRETKVNGKSTHVEHSFGTSHKGPRSSIIPNLLDQVRRRLALCRPELEISSQGVRLNFRGKEDSGSSIFVRGPRLQMDTESGVVTSLHSSTLSKWISCERFHGSDMNAQNPITSLIKKQVEKRVLVRLEDKCLSMERRQRAQTRDISVRKEAPAFNAEVVSSFMSELFPDESDSGTSTSDVDNEELRAFLIADELFFTDVEEHQPRALLNDTFSVPDHPNVEAFSTIIMKKLDTATWEQVESWGLSRKFYDEAKELINRLAPTSDPWSEATTW